MVETLSEVKLRFGPQAVAARQLQARLAAATSASQLGVLQARLGLKRKSQVLAFFLASSKPSV